MKEVAFISKVHGLKGEVYVSLSNEAYEPLMSANQLLYIRQLSGDFTPVRIGSVRPDRKPGAEQFFVLFRGVSGRTDAELLKNLSVFTEASIAESLESEFEELVNQEIDEAEAVIFGCIGFLITDPESALEGKVIEVTDNPAHPIIRALINEVEVLIPAVDAYISHIDAELKCVHATNLNILYDFAIQED
ncbi:MAG: hypothetical protein LAT67_03575 [Balneolales bacterium]|nr:hypothetical protein [Balneolales bacterium]